VAQTDTPRSTLWHVVVPVATSTVAAVLAWWLTQGGGISQLAVATSAAAVAFSNLGVWRYPVAGVPLLIGLSLPVVAIRRRARRAAQDSAETATAEATVAAPPTSTTEQAQCKYDLARLPMGSGPIRGRDALVKQMRAAFDAPRITLFALSGLGGVGKTAIARAFVDDLSTGESCAARRVFAWSFEVERPGAGVVDSLGAFWDAALRFWDFDGELPVEPSEKARELAARMEATPSVLVLDNFEVLQRRDGAITDRAIIVLLDGLRREGMRHRGLVVITSRRPLAGLRDTGAQQTMLWVDGDDLRLPPSAGADLLADQGVVGKRAELEAAAAELDGHPLTIALVGSALAKGFAGDVLRLGELLADIGGQDRVTAILEYYLEGWPAASPQRQLLYLMSVFGVPVHRDEIAPLVQRAGLDGALSGMAQPAITGVLSELVALGLVRHDGSAYDIHSLAAAYFAGQFAAREDDAFRKVHLAMVDSALDRAHESIESIEDLEPLYRALSHACLAGEYERAFNDIYLPRISEGGRFLNASVLGDRTGDIRAIACFFPSGVASGRNPALEPSKRWWLVARAAFDLSSLGRFEESIGPRRAGISIVEELGAWGHVADDSRRLAHTLVNLGRLDDAMATIATAVKAAEKYRAAPERATTIPFLPGKDPETMWRRCISDRAYVSTLMGKNGDLDGAWAETSENDEKEAYHRLLLSRATSERELASVRLLAERALAGARSSGKKSTIANYEIVLSQALRRLGDLDGAGPLVDEACRLMDDWGRVDGLMRAVAEKAAILEARWRIGHDPICLVKANDVLDELEQLATFSGAELLRADGELVRVAVLRDQGKTEEAHSRLSALSKSMRAMGYRLHDADVALLAREVGV